MEIMGINPLAEVSNIISTMKAPGEVVALGNQWFGAAALIALTWFGIRLALEQGAINRVASGLMRNILFLALAWWFMPGQGDLCTMIKDYGHRIAVAFAGTEDLSSVVGDGITQIIRSVGALGKVLSDLITGGQPISGVTDMIAAIGRLTLNGVTILYMAFAFVMLLLTIVGYFVMWVMSLGLVAIATMLAPIFVPFLVLPSVTGFLFDGWLRFLIVGVLYQVVGALILHITNSVITATIGRYADLAAAANVSSPAVIADMTMMSIIVAGVTLSLAVLMLQCGSLAQGLVSGNASFKLSAIGGETKQVGGGVQQSIQRSVSSTGSQAMQASNSMRQGIKRISDSIDKTVNDINKRK